MMKMQVDDVGELSRRERNASSRRSDLTLSASPAVSSQLCLSAIVLRRVTLKSYMQLSQLSDQLWSPLYSESLK